MFRAHDEEETPSLSNIIIVTDQQQQQTRLYPNLNLESTVNAMATNNLGASVLLIRDEGFHPVIMEDNDEEEEEEELTLGQQSSPKLVDQQAIHTTGFQSPIVERIQGFSTGTPTSNQNLDGLNEVVLTPRSSAHGYSSNRSSRSNSNVSTNKRIVSTGYYYGSSPNEDALSGLTTPRWNLNGEDDIDIEYATGGSSSFEYNNQNHHLFNNEYNEPIHRDHDFEEFELGVAACREEITSWQRFIELRVLLAEVPILNRVISFVYYPNLLNTTNDMKTNDIANMLKSILRLRLVNKKWKQSIDNPTGVLYHYLLEYSSIQKSISLKNLKLSHSEFNFFSIPGIYMVGIGKIIGQTSLIPLEMGTRAYTKMEQDYGSATANTILALGAGITIASGSFALFMLSGAFYLMPIAAGGYVLDKAIEFGLDYSNKKSAEKEIIQTVEEKEKALDSFRMKMRKITQFENMVIEKYEGIQAQGNDASWTGYIFSFASMENKHSVYYLIDITMKIEESTYTYTLKKRYSQFEKLFQRMCTVRKTDKIVGKNGEVLIFPYKEIIDSLLGTRSKDIIEKRKELFNKILFELVNNLDEYKDDEEIMVFFTDSEQYNSSSSK